jgi:hypothetical protein
MFVFCIVGVSEVLFVNKVKGKKVICAGCATQVVTSHKTEQIDKFTNKNTNI